jgi:hypothetical protein
MLHKFWSVYRIATQWSMLRVRSELWRLEVACFSETTVTTVSSEISTLQASDMWSLVVTYMAANTLEASLASILMVVLCLKYGGSRQCSFVHQRFEQASCIILHGSLSSRSRKQQILLKYFHITTKLHGVTSHLILSLWENTFTVQNIFFSKFLYVFHDMAETWGTGVAQSVGQLTTVWTARKLEFHSPTNTTYWSQLCIVYTGSEAHPLPV